MTASRLPPGGGRQNSVAIQGAVAAVERLVQLGHTIGGHPMAASLAQVHRIRGKQAEGVEPCEVAAALRAEVGEEGRSNEGVADRVLPMPHWATVRAVAAAAQHRAEGTGQVRPGTELGEEVAEGEGGRGSDQPSRWDHSAQLHPFAPEE